MVPRGHGNLLGIGALHGGVVVLDEVLLVLGRVQKCNTIFFVQYLKPGEARGSQGKPGEARGSQGKSGEVRGSQGKSGEVRGSQGKSNLNLT